MKAGRRMISRITNLFPQIRNRLRRFMNGQNIKTIAVCAAQVPFFSGGAEAHVDGLVRQLKGRGFEVDLINIPYKWYPKEQLLRSIEIWEKLDLSESNGKKIDLIITTKFPSYFARHRNRVLWLIHQYRQMYDLFDTPYSGFERSRSGDLELRERLIEMDTRALRSYKKIYTNSKNTADRLKKYNGIDATALYHPPRLGSRYWTGEYEDYVLSVGRLDSLKRVDLLVKSLRFCGAGIRCKIAGTGPEAGKLKTLAHDCGLSNRVDFLGFVPDDELLELYARCSTVFFAPLDEDYGYITLEAFLSKKPVITAFDSGGPLEFVVDGQNGIVLDSLKEKEIGEKIENLVGDKERCKRFGANGYSRVKDINWDFVVQNLLSGNRI